MAIYHTVLFTFKPELSKEEIKDACDQLLSLGQRCLHPTTGAPYLKVLGFGKENSIEGRQGDVTHIMVAKFDNAEDREHYVNKDPAHGEVIQLVKPKVTKIQVVDFTPGEY
ncbi:stress responsive A/B barrel domain-containing protein [Xylaria sp. CBS 124048]|nr:stress responsive A/B barrel domain-containing protein [Xylaria sp. CBS 124048]